MPRLLISGGRWWSTSKMEWKPIWNHIQMRILIVARFVMSHSLIMVIWLNTHKFIILWRHIAVMCGCSRQFTHNGNLKRNKMIHTGETVQCAVCSKEFKDNHNMKRHMRFTLGKILSNVRCVLSNLLKPSSERSLKNTHWWNPF